MFVLQAFLSPYYGPVKGDTTSWPMAMTITDLESFTMSAYLPKQAEWLPQTDRGTSQSLKCRRAWFIFGSKPHSIVYGTPDEHLLCYVILKHYFIPSFPETIPILFYSFPATET